MDRQRVIIRTGIVGIIVNILLAGFKAAVGLLSNSIAVVLDAVNNLSDALSSVITIIGAKLSAKPADKKHPLGHGRVEYLTAITISVIILYAGITSLIESVKKIIQPELPDYGTAALIVISVAVPVKIILGLYVQNTGKRVNSDALRASGKDALLDAVISGSVLAAAIIYLIWGVSLEAYLGVLISLYIIKSGIDMLRESISRILGERIDNELSRDIKRELSSYAGVSGAYDLILHSYGPEMLVGSVHIEVPYTMTAPELDALERRMAVDIYAKYGVMLTGISIYSVNLSDPETDELFHAINDELRADPRILQIHGFNLDKAASTVTFDIIISFDEKDRHALYEQVVADLQKKYPQYRFCVTLDSDISD